MSSLPLKTVQVTIQESKEHKLVLHQCAQCLTKWMCTDSHFSSLDYDFLLCSCHRRISFYPGVNNGIIQELSLYFCGRTCQRLYNRFDAKKLWSDSDNDSNDDEN